MNSEKVEDIKLALEIAIKTGECRKKDTYLGPVKVLEILEYINELESENERLNKSEIGELIKENEELAKQCVEWSELDFKKRNKITELKDRIAELEEYIKGNEQDAKAFVSGWHKDLETELKQFAKRLKEMAYKSTDWSHGEHPLVVEVDYIDEVLEEFLK